MRVGDRTGPTGRSRRSLIGRSTADRYSYDMAREESDREDLLREATALVERIEFAPVGGYTNDHVVAGFRAGGGLSIYFGSDPSYQFNSHGELRRAFVDGLLVKAERGRLVALKRVRQARKVDLVQHGLSDSEQADFLANLQQRFRDLAADCQNNQLRIIGEVPSGADVLTRVLTEIGRLRNAPVAVTPHAS